MKEKKSRAKKSCQDCGPVFVPHYQHWVEDLERVFSPFRFFYIPAKTHYFLGGQVDKIFFMFGLARLSKDIYHREAPLRTTVFMREAEKEGWGFLAVKTKRGFNNHFYMMKDGKKFAFEGLPRAEFLHKKKTTKIDDKIFVKKFLEKEGLPVAKGKAFAWWQKKKALRWAEENDIFPAVVKPRFGSMSQHVTMNIENKEDLEGAISKANTYAPFFIVEKHIAHRAVYRATVVDGEFVACTRRIPAYVVGDGQKTVRALVEEKNQDPKRGLSGQLDFTYYHLILDETSERILKEQDLSLDAIPKAGREVFTQEKVILDLGADVEGVTSKTHPDNLALFRQVAKIAGAFLVGIDFLAQDIAQSWREQECAIIELNSLPYIDAHHHPSIGAPTNISRAIVEAMGKYYK